MEYRLEGPQESVKLNVEHTFVENVKEVRKGKRKEAVTLGDGKMDLEC